jgi:hypothetical protein
LKLKIALLILAILVLAAFSPAMQGVQRFTGILAQYITVSGNSNLQGYLPNRSQFLRYQDVAAAPAIFAAATAIPTIQALTPGELLGIETPRNLKITWTTTTTATAGNITVTGIDARGNSAMDIIAVAAVSGTQTLVGNVAFVSISAVDLYSTRAETATITIVGGQKFGLPKIPLAAGDVYLLTVNATPQAAPTVSTTYGTFDPVSTPAASVDYNVWLKQ